MNQLFAILLAVYLVGVLLCYAMHRVEYEAEGNVYTKGSRVLNVFLSLLSWFMVLLILINSWIKLIAKTGYWSRPVKTEEIKPKTE